jgi:hypothetical protein
MEEQKRRGRPPKQQIADNPRHKPMVCVRDPVVENRDPVIEQPRRVCNPRRYIPASMPTICPECGHNTRCDSGRHIDPVRCKIVEYRRCSKCNLLLGAGRPMTEREKELLCKGAEVIKDYEKSELQ